MKDALASASLIQAEGVRGETETSMTNQNAANAIAPVEIDNLLEIRAHHAELARNHRGTRRAAGQGGAST